MFLLKFIVLVYVLAITFVILNMIEQKDAQLEISLSRAFLLGLAYNKEFAPKDITGEDKDLYLISFQLCFGPIVVTLTMVEDAETQ